MDRSGCGGQAGPSSASATAAAAVGLGHHSAAAVPLNPFLSMYPVPPQASHFSPLQQQLPGAPPTAGWWPQQHNGGGFMPPLPVAIPSASMYASAPHYQHHHHYQQQQSQQQQWVALRGFPQPLPLPPYPAAGGMGVPPAAMTAGPYHLPQNDVTTTAMAHWKNAGPAPRDIPQNRDRNRRVYSHHAAKRQKVTTERRTVTSVAAAAGVAREQPTINDVTVFMQQTSSETTATASGTLQLTNKQQQQEQGVAAVQRQQLATEHGSVATSNGNNARRRQQHKHQRDAQGGVGSMKKNSDNNNNNKKRKYSKKMTKGGIANTQAACTSGISRKSSTIVGDSPEEIAAWIAERRRNFPTQANILRKLEQEKANAEEKSKRNGTVHHAEAAQTASATGTHTQGKNKHEEQAEKLANKGGTNASGKKSQKKRGSSRYKKSVLPPIPKPEQDFMRKLLARELASERRAILHCLRHFAAQNFFK